MGGHSILAVKMASVAVKTLMVLGSGAPFCICIVRNREIDRQTERETHTHTQSETERDRGRDKDRQREPERQIILVHVTSFYSIFTSSIQLIGR